MKQLVKRVLNRAGIYYAKHQYMPRGIDWLWDIKRVARGLPVRTVFDVGANVGQTTRMIKEQFADAEVHAFEPVSTTFQSLERNVRQLSGVTCHRLALCERVGRATVTAVNDSQLNRLVTDAEVPDLAEIERVDTETIEHFCTSHEIESIDILKVDAEGADLRVLKGGQAMLRQGRIAFVLVEAGFREDDAGHVPLPALYDFLRDAGLTLYSLYDHYHEEGERQLLFANVLFLSPAAISRMQ